MNPLPGAPGAPGGPRMPMIPPSFIFHAHPTQTGTSANIQDENGNTQAATASPQTNNGQQDDIKDIIAGVIAKLTS